MTVICISYFIIWYKIPSLGVPQGACDDPFVFLRGQCVFFDDTASVTWSDARDLCDTINSHLIKFDDDMLLWLSVLDYMINHGEGGNQVTICHLNIMYVTLHHGKIKLGS